MSHLMMVQRNGRCLSKIANQSAYSLVNFYMIVKKSIKSWQQISNRFWYLARLLGFLGFIMICTFAGQIYVYASVSSPQATDVAIVLGAAVWDGQPSPVFEERIKHGIYLFQSGRVEYLVFTGGVGEGDISAESEVARLYAINKGIPSEKILIEQNSQITYENLYEACQVMVEAQLQTALIVSDPLHMKRAMSIAQDIGLDAYPSPTPTSRYQTWRSKSGALAYELFFYMIHLGSKAVGSVERCSN